MVIFTILVFIVHKHGSSVYQCFPKFVYSVFYSFHCRDPYRIQQGICLVPDSSFIGDSIIISFLLLFLDPFFYILLVGHMFPEICPFPLHFPFFFKYAFSKYMFLWISTVSLIMSYFVSNFIELIFSFFSLVG
jgi:hypothetical protein